MKTAPVDIRQAVAGDTSFLIESIIAAEKSGTDKLSYCTLFGISEVELRLLLIEILAEDIAGQELCISGFLIAEIEGQPAGAVCSWIEGSGGKPSGILKGNLLFHFFGHARIVAAAENLKLAEDLSLARMGGALQIESVFVPAQFRGRGICRQLIAAHQDEARRRCPQPMKAQIQLVKSNDNAFRAYEKLGFSIVAERQSQNQRIMELLPSASKILMEHDLIF